MEITNFTKKEQENLSAKIIEFINKRYDLPDLNFSVGNLNFWGFDIESEKITKEKQPKLFGIFGNLFDEAYIKIEVHSVSVGLRIIAKIITDKQDMHFDFILHYNRKKLIEVLMDGTKLNEVI